MSCVPLLKHHFMHTPLLATPTTQTHFFSKLHRYGIHILLSLLILAAAIIKYFKNGNMVIIVCTVVIGVIIQVPLLVILTSRIKTSQQGIYYSGWYYRDGFFIPWSNVQIIVEIQKYEIRSVDGTHSVIFTYDIGKFDDLLDTLEDRQLKPISHRTDHLPPRTTEALSADRTSVLRSSRPRKIYLHTMFFGFVFMFLMMGIGFSIAGSVLLLLQLPRYIGLGAAYLVIGGPMLLGGILLCLPYRNKYIVVYGEGLELPKKLKRIFVPWRKISHARFVVGRKMPDSIKVYKRNNPFSVVTVSGKKNVSALRDMLEAYEITITDSNNNPV